MIKSSNTNSEGKWKQCLHSQLLDRDKKESGVLANIIHQLNVLAEQCESFRLENAQLTIQQRRDSGVCAGTGAVERQTSHIQELEQKVYRLNEEVTCLHRTKSDNAEQLVVVTNCLQDRDKELQQQKNRTADLESEVMLLKEECTLQKDQVEQVTTINTLLRDEYTSLNMVYEALDGKYARLKEENAELVHRWIEYKAQDAERLNAENDRHFQNKQRAVAASLREAAEDFKCVVLPTEVDNCSMAMLGTLSCPFSVMPSTCFYNMDAHDGDVHTLRMNSDGRLLATGGEDRKLKLWNVRRDGLTHYQTLLGSNAGINSIEFSPDSSLVLAASTDCASRIWSIPDLRIRHTLTGHSAKVMACKFMADISKVVTAGHDRTIKIWDLKSKACSRTIFVGSSCNDLDVCAASPTLVFSGHLDKKMRIYDLRVNNEACEIPVQDKVTSVSIFNNTYNCLLSCRDNVLRVVDIRRKEVLYELVADGLHLGCDSTRAAISPDDRLAAVGSSDGTVYVWDVQDRTVMSTMSGGHSSCVMACCWSPDGQVFYSGERSKQVRMWTGR